VRLEAKSRADSVFSQYGVRPCVGVIIVGTSSPPHNTQIEQIPRRCAKPEVMCPCCSGVAAGASAGTWKPTAYPDHPVDFAWLSLAQANARTARHTCGTRRRPAASAASCPEKLPWGRRHLRRRPSQVTTCSMHIMKRRRPRCPVHYYSSFLASPSLINQLVGSCHGRTRTRTRVIETESQSQNHSHRSTVTVTMTDSHGQHHIRSSDIQNRAFLSLISCRSRARNEP
jgi:hypothetical protein